MYRAYDGIIGGNRLVNDDGDIDPVTQGPRIDEDFLDGHDNDGDGRIDEDYAALGQLMWSCVMRDDTPASLSVVQNEKHVPLVLEMRQLAWAYSVPGFQNFDVADLTVFNRSGHMLDSLYFGFRVDIDSGPLTSSSYFNDDQDLPYFPSGEFAIPVSVDDPRYQATFNDKGQTVPTCGERTIKVNGFSVVDNDGDESRTPGVASFLLFGHTVDPLGVRAPKSVGFRACLHFRFRGSATPEWTVVVDGPTCSVAEGLVGAPDCVVTTTEETYVALETGRESPEAAFMMGRVKVSNVGVMTRFVKLFRRLET